MREPHDTFSSRRFNYTEKWARSVQRNWTIYMLRGIIGSVNYLDISNLIRHSSAVKIITICCKEIDNL